MRRLLILGSVVIAALQVEIVRSEEAPGAAAALKEQVRELQDHGREQAAEIERLRKRLASSEVEASGQAQRRRAQEGEEEGVQELKAAGGAEEVEEGEEGGEETEEEREEELEEEETDPVDLTLSISLLSYITFVMTLFRLCHYEDQDMRIYVWNVLSNTLSIFLAVLLFTSLNGLCHRSIPEGASNFIIIGVDFMQLFFCFTAMQVAVAFISGSFEKQPFQDSADMSFDEQKAQRERRFKSVATLLAHMSGFAAINFGGGIQQMDVLQRTPPLTFLVPPALFLFQIVACRLVRKVRQHFIKQILATHIENKDTYTSMSPSGNEPVEEGGQGRPGIEWCVGKWDEETYESENEISSLAISFLLLQAIRYNLTGIMPNNIGIEEFHWKHPQHDVYELAGCGMILAVLCVVIVVLVTDYFPESAEILPGTFMSFMKRVALVAQGSMAMGFAWALMYTSKWEITLLLPNLNPNCVTARVLLAVCISCFAFFIILGLDYIADLKSTGEKADRSIIAIIQALSILVGFTWEQSFDGAVEALSESCFKEHPLTAEMCLTGGILVVVYPQWRRYVLRTLLKLKEEKARQNAAE